MTVDTLLASMVVGIVAGWLAGEIWRGYGFGLVGNLIVGIVGALVGTFLFSALSLGAGRVVGVLVMAFAGAMVLLFAAHMVARAARIA